MSEPFFLYPTRGRRFDVDAIREALLAAEGVTRNPSDANGVIIAETVAAARAIAADMAANPNTPQWAVFVHLEPSIIHVYREAMQPALDRFKPILQYLLRQGVGEVKDEEGRVIQPLPAKEMVEFLLA